MSDDNKLDLILAKLGNLQQDISVLKQDVLMIKLHLGNVTDKYIATWQKTTVV